MSFTYVLKKDGVEYRGRLGEIYPLTNYSKKEIHRIACGYKRCPPDLDLHILEDSVGCDGNSYKKRVALDEWDEVVALFKNVKWVKKNG